MFFESWLAIKVSRLSPLCSFTVSKKREVLTCSWFCCCFCAWCFHNFYILILFVVCCIMMVQRCFDLSWSENWFNRVVFFIDSIVIISDSKRSLAVKVSILCPLCSFAIFEWWKVLSCFWFCCCSVTWCFHNFYILVVVFKVTYNR